MKASSVGAAASLILIFGFGIVCQNAPTPPAPTVDRIGFPADYQSWKLLYRFDRPDNKSVRTIYGNAAAAAATFATQADYPYGSIIVMETWRSLQDSNGNPILDANGRFQKDPAATPTVFAMKKDHGFGVDYGPNRNGEWEYVAYHPDGTFQTTPQNSFSCAVCHLQATHWRDWVFRGNLYFSNANGAVPAGVIQHYAFVPGVIHAKPGDTITIYNDDVIQHSIVDDVQPGGDSGLLNPGTSIAIGFGKDASGEFNFHCKIHPTMHGKIVIDQPQP
jgi:plastocyanin